MLLAGAMGVVSIPGELYAAALPESQLAKSKLVYFIDCGDESVDTVDEGESFGTNNSVTEQVYGADPKTGKQWGILDDVSDPLKNDPGTNKTNAVYTDWTWPEAVWGTKEESFRYTKNQFENQHGNDASKVRYIDYKFELDKGTYLVETYTRNTWNNSRTTKLILDTQESTRDAITEAYQNNKGTLLTPETVTNERVTLDKDGFLTVSYRGSGAENLAIQVSYIKIIDITDVPLKDFADSDLADIYFANSVVSDNLILPTKGAYGSTIAWTSDKPSVIATDGTVTRPAEGSMDATVTLTATASYEGETFSKDFTFTVPAVNGLENNFQFALDEVNVTDAYYLSAQKADITFLKKFDNDRLLSRFRETAKLDTKGAKPYNGWENSLIGGHCVGHYLTACAQAVKTTGDAELKAKLDAIIKELKVCQDTLGTGFIFGAEIRDPKNVELQFDIVECTDGSVTGDTWVPWYTMHKIIQGLIDVYRYTDNEEALTIAEGLGEWVYNRVSKWTEAQQFQIMCTEYGGMNDCLYELYKLSDSATKTHFRDAAHQFDDPGLYAEITDGTDNRLNNRHANTTIPKFIGALNRYIALKEVDGKLTEEDEKYLEYAEKFWTLVTEKHAFITGGVSDMEHFKADNALDAIRTQCDCESCCANNLLKFSKELYKITGDKKYADYYENTLRNAIMGAIDTTEGADSYGSTTYFTPMATGYYKYFGNGDPAENMFWCCTGTGMENFTKLGDSIYFHTDSGLIVNQYVASNITWAEKKVKLTQDSDVTKTEDATFTVNLLDDTTSVDMKLYLRVPDWVSGTPTVKINGKVYNGTISGGYISINRTWQNGDTVLMTNPMKVVAYGLPDNDTVYAFKYGPTVLAAKLGTEKMDEKVWAGANLEAAGYKVVGPESAYLQVTYGTTTRQILGTETISILDSVTLSDFLANINDYMEKEEGELSFKLKGTDADTTFTDGLTFVPFNTLNHERYGIYWYFEDENSVSEEGIRASKEEGRLAKSIIDSIQPGYPQYETDDIHQLSEKNTVFENLQGVGSTRWIKAGGGSFTYKMKVRKDSKNRLLCQFATEDAGKKIQIKAGDALIATETVEAKEDVLSYQKYYDIPQEVVDAAETLTIGDESYDVIKVTFASADTSQASARIVAGLYMTVPYSTNAQLTEVTASTGTVALEDDTITVTVPQGTDTTYLKFTIADTNGLLYIADTLVNDSKSQKFTVDETETKIKVYAEDHETYKEYTLKFVEKAGIADDGNYGILVNGGFENGLANWSQFGSATLTADTDNCYSGMQSAKISNRANTYDGISQNITGKLVAGATYQTTAWIKTEAAQNIHICICYRGKSSDTDKTDWMVNGDAATGEWTKITGKYMIPKDADLSNVELYLESDNTATFYVDYVSMIKTKDPEVDTAAINAVIEAINAIGTVTYDTVCKAKIDAAKAAYDKLTAAEKEKVTNAEALTTAITSYETLKTQAEEEKQQNQEAADAVISLIEQIGTVTNTTDSKNAIDAARAAYEKLTEEQKKLVTNYAILTGAETTYTEIMTPSENPPADNKPTDSQTTGGQTTGGQTANNQNTDKQPADDAATTLMEGTVYTSGNYSYKITSLTDKTVTVVKATKKSKTITIRSTVKIDGITFKITEVAKNAFKGNTKVTSVKLGKNITTIGANAFYGCKNLKKVTINSKVLKKIDTKAFYNCKKLSSVKITSSKLTKVGKEIFKGTAKKLKVDVPDKKVKSYKKLFAKSKMAKTASVK